MSPACHPAPTARSPALRLRSATHGAQWSHERATAPTRRPVAAPCRPGPAGPSPSSPPSPSGSRSSLRRCSPPPTAPACRRSRPSSSPRRSPTPSSSRCPARSSTPRGSACRQLPFGDVAAPTRSPARRQLDHARLDRRRRPLPRRAARRDLRVLGRAGRPAGVDVLEHRRRGRPLLARRGRHGPVRRPRAQADAGELPVRATCRRPPRPAAQAVGMAKVFSTVTLDAQTKVAGRDAYQLVVTPTSQTTLVGQDRGGRGRQDQHAAARAGVEPRDTKTPALEIGFTDVTFATPADSVLAFSAPAGRQHQGRRRAAARREPSTAPRPGHAPRGRHRHRHRLGHRRAGVRPRRRRACSPGDPARRAGPGSGPPRPSARRAPSSCYDQFAPEQGSGSAAGQPGHVGRCTTRSRPRSPRAGSLDSALLSVLVTDDGRVLVGAVPGETLQALARMTAHRDRPWPRPRRGAATARPRDPHRGSDQAVPVRAGRRRRHRPARPARRGLRLPRPERLGQDDDHPDAARAWSGRRAGTPWLLGGRMPEAGADVLPRVGALVEGPAFHPYLTGRANLARLDAIDATADPRTAATRVRRGPRAGRPRRRPRPSRTGSTRSA